MRKDHSFYSQSPKGFVERTDGTNEGLATLMCEVEAILNGRPLTKVSGDPKKG